MFIAQLSDPHVDTAQPHKAGALRRAVAFLLSLPRTPDAVLITGDCTEHGHPQEYEEFQAALAPLTMPVYVVPGNHDRRDELLARFAPPGQSLDGFLQYVVEDWPLRLIGLDTHWPGQGAGQLCPARLAWLDRVLAQAPSRPTLLFMHHPPTATGLRVLDEIGLQGRAELCEVVQRHPQVVRVLAGHVHMPLTASFAHTTVMTCPGTDATFQPDWAQTEQLVIQYQPPLALLHRWDERSGLLSFTAALDAAPWVTLHDGQRWAG
ncbi:phosphodiesterase [Deinococcus arcticus]|uniref:Phosphodiesterase n=1 Tax=Deinococcus arcticus TaxID=2136176 RepID=A0A2T3W9H3_9DEIO|nr:phosphodiesterase [Deinococcus arcticus]PTA68403.1 phosphodiesterase [Deinococcus arcticus]